MFGVVSGRSNGSNGSNNGARPRYCVTFVTMALMLRLRQWATTAQNVILNVVKNLIATVEILRLRLRSTQGGKERVVTVVTSVHALVTALLRYYVTRLPAVADNIRKYLSKYLTTAFYCCIFVSWEVCPLPRQYNNKYSAKALIINTMLYIYLT